MSGPVVQDTLMSRIEGSRKKFWGKDLKETAIRNV